VRKEPCDPQSLERQVRGLLADKVSGNLVGIWLLIPEYLRLGAWDLLKGWSGATDERVEARLALQLVNEAALCVNGIREKRSLSQKGFELANGLPFVATDGAIHFLLNDHTVDDAKRLQMALGKIRDTFGHFAGKVLAIDPHRVKSHSKRQMVRHRGHAEEKAFKKAHTFFCLDADTCQPLCFVTGTSARTATDAAKELLEMSARILRPAEERALVVADTEHYTAALFDWVRKTSRFDLLTPVCSSKSLRNAFLGIDQDRFERHWPGYATTTRTYQFKNYDTEPFHQFIQRKGERKEDYDFKAFLCTSDRPIISALADGYPDRWHIEEFFETDQALGWHRAGTRNLNIQYGKMTMSLLAQAALHMLRARIGGEISRWDAKHFANDLLKGLEGDVRVRNDTIIVTYYNGPRKETLVKHYEQLPKKLAEEGVPANIPWLYGYKLDFRFK
jgi:hypothetical protein